MQVNSIDSPDKTDLGMSKTSILRAEMMASAVIVNTEMKKNGKNNNFND